MNDPNIPAPKNIVRYIILASFESLNMGMSHNIFPKICNDSNNIMILLKNNYVDKSYISRIVNQILFNKQIEYEERIVKDRKNFDEEDEKENEEKIKEQEKKKKI